MLWKVTDLVVDAGCHSEAQLKQPFLPVVVLVLPLRLRKSIIVAVCVFQSKSSCGLLQQTPTHGGLVFGQDDFSRVLIHCFYTRKTPPPFVFSLSSKAKFEKR